MSTWTAVFGLAVGLSASAVDLCVLVPDHDEAIEKAGQHPWLSGVQVHALHPVRASSQLLSDVKPQRL